MKTETRPLLGLIEKSKWWEQPVNDNMAWNDTMEKWEETIREIGFLGDMWDYEDRADFHRDL